MTIEQARRLNSRYQAAATKTNVLRDQRNQAMRETAAAGVKLADISRALNMTRSRVSQIVSGQALQR